MIESQVRALFTAIASSEPDASQVDTQLAHRRGRARLRWRRAGVAGAPLVAAAAAAAVALAVGAAAPQRPASSVRLPRTCRSAGCPPGFRRFRAA